MCTFENETDDANYFGSPYFSISASSTPFVHPKPSCEGYSPPPASRLRSDTLYFSINLPVRLNTSTFSLIQRSPISLAISLCPQRSNPQMVIHSSGAHPFG